MSNPDNRVHASETCMAIITFLVVLVLLALTIASVVEAY